MTFGGWQRKADVLRGVMLSAGHQLARPLDPGIQALMDAYRDAAKTSEDTPNLRQKLDTAKGLIENDPKSQIWEPVHDKRGEPSHIYGWHFNATMYLENDQLYWLLHAQRPRDAMPTDNELGFLRKVVEHLGADIVRDQIIGPWSPNGDSRFGWWTWFNQWPLVEIQSRKARPGATAPDLRYVPLGTPPSDGYERIDMTKPPTHATDGHGDMQ